MEAMERIRNLCVFLLIVILTLVVEVTSKYKTKLILSERRYDTVIDCGTNAAVGVQDAVGGYVLRDGPCAKGTDQTNWITCVTDECRSDGIDRFKGCQGNQLCRVKPSSTVQRLHTCAESNYTNVLHVKYRCSRDATSYVIVASVLTFLVIVLFLLLFIKLRKPAD